MWRLLRSNNSGTRWLFITLFLYGRLSPGAAEGKRGERREREREMQALYLVIFQMQQSSAKIKFIRFSMDIAVHFPPFVGGVGKRQRRGGV